MSIRKKVFIIFGVSVVVLSLLAFIVARVTFYDRFVRHEREMIREEAYEMVSLYARNLDGLAAIAGDWGPWDDTYRFLKERDPGYIESNLDPETIQNLCTDFVVLFDRAGAVVHSVGVERHSLEVVPVPDELLANRALRQWVQTVPAEFTPLKGLIQSRKGLLLVAAAPVLTSKRQGPVVGALMVARLVDRELLENWEATLAVKIVAEPEATTAGPVPTEMSGESFTGLGYWVGVRPLNEDRIAAWVQLDDLAGARRTAFRIDMDRLLYRQAKATLRLYSFSIAFVALVIGAGFLALLDRQVLTRLERLTGSVQEIAQARSLRQRLPQDGDDELGRLAAAGNDLLQALEQATLESRARERDLHRILENNPAAILLVDIEERTITWANSNALALIGDNAERVFGHLCHRYVCAAERGQCPVLDLQQQRDSSERILLRADGKQIPVFKRAVKVSYQGRAHLLEAFFDISRQKELERDLRRAQSMEMLGVMAGGVAHDLNNTLMALVGYPDLMLAQLAADHPFRKPLEALQKSAQKAAELVEDLLSLARRNVAPVERIPVNQVVEEHRRSSQFRWLQGLHPEVEFRWALAPEEIHVMGSRVHLTKVLMNLVHNAAEAITTEGRVEVVVRPLHLGSDLAGFEKVPAGDYALLQVSDTGCGMAETDLPRIFEPFFSRKAMQRSGSGLGMTVVWNCVKDMGGFIDVTSMVGRGTCFRLYLPLTDDIASLDAVEVEIESRLGKGERILVVDDQDDQRRLVELMLKDLGYRVRTAQNLADAREQALEWSPELCILDMLLDAGSDGPDGLDVFRALREVRPSLKAIIASGFAETERVKEALRIGAAGYLKKPFTPRQLAGLLHRALGHDVCPPV